MTDFYADIERIKAELADSFDEELEMALDESCFDGEGERRGLERRSYFRELFALQYELVRLQDWVQSQGLKVVVLFEGRDSAGKGGAIKRITQRLNPRICRVAALPAPNGREKTQWYFQRYVSHLPAAGEIVLFDRSWYNRAGVERVMGFCTQEEVEEFFRSVPEFERMLIRSGIILIKYWFSITDEEQQFRFHMRIEDPLKQWKLAHGCGIAPPLGRLHGGQGRDVGAHPYPRGSMVGGRGGGQEEGAAQLHRASSGPDPLWRCGARAGRAAAACPA
jgi:polyphosphate kinase 2